MNKRNYPALEIDLDDIYKNTREVVKRASQFGISITAVTKVLTAIRSVAEAFEAGGAIAIGDSRVQNLEKLLDMEIERWLIRIPMISEAEEVVKYSTLSLNSEVEVIKALNDAARKLKKHHGVILMIDHGDLREGWFDEDDFYRAVKRIKDFDWIDVRGIGTNSNCAGAVIPEPETFKRFPKLLQIVQESFDIQNPIVSGGNSGAYYMIEDGTIPPVINNLRLGELLLFGHETSYQVEYPYLSQDVLNLIGEIVEIKEKCEMLNPKVDVSVDGRIRRKIFSKKFL